MGTEKAKLKIGISIGDLNGVGPEIALKAFADARMLDFFTPVLFANNKVISQQKKALNIDVNFNGVPHASKAVDGKINVALASKVVPPLKFGEMTDAAGKFAVSSLKAGVMALKKGDIDALVTLPINKNNVKSEDFPFTGHTEFLHKELEGNSLMFMVSDEVRVGLLTDHIPVKDVANAITTKLVRDKVMAMEKSLITDFAINRPKIALLGINPHSGDNGTIGKEDDEILKPAIAQLFKEGHFVFGPYAADGFFGTKNHKNFDAVLAAYHDQGLVPFKTLSFGKGVNFTAGLNKVRTSPDHGTAFDIAGKGEADPRSFIEAMFLAASIVKKREDYGEYAANPLKRQPRKGKDRG